MELKLKVLGLGLELVLGLATARLRRTCGIFRTHFFSCVGNLPIYALPHFWVTPTLPVRCQHHHRYHYRFTRTMFCLGDPKRTARCQEDVQTKNYASRMMRLMPVVFERFSRIKK